MRRVRDPLLRLDGVGDIRMYGARDYSMRLWLDPDKMAELGLAAADLLASVRSQNVQIAGGQIAEPPISDRAARAPQGHRPDRAGGPLLLDQQLSPAQAGSGTGGHPTTRDQRAGHGGRH